MQIFFLDWVQIRRFKRMGKMWSSFLSMDNEWLARGPQCTGIWLPDRIHDKSDRRPTELARPPRRLSRYVKLVYIRRSEMFQSWNEFKLLTAVWRSFPLIAGRCLAFLGLRSLKIADCWALPRNFICLRFFVAPCSLKVFDELHRASSDQRISFHLFYFIFWNWENRVAFTRS